jgi:hypothetical protein
MANPAQLNSLAHHNANSSYEAHPVVSLLAQAPSIPERRVPIRSLRRDTVPATHCSDPITTVPMMVRPYPIGSWRRYFPSPLFLHLVSALLHPSRCSAMQEPPLQALPAIALMHPRSVVMWSSTSGHRSL